MNAKNRPGGGRFSSKGRGGRGGQGLGPGHIIGEDIVPSNVLMHIRRFKPGVTARDIVNFIGPNLDDLILATSHNIQPGGGGSGDLYGWLWCGNCNFNRVGICGFGGCFGWDNKAKEITWDKKF